MAGFKGLLELLEELDEGLEGVGHGEDMGGLDKEIGFWLIELADSIERC